MNTILFDLDGTLLTMDTDRFMELYLEALTKAFKPHMNTALFQARLWEGTKMMLKNNGETMSNEKVFYETFFNGMEGQKELMIKVFEDFYQLGFNQARAATEQNEHMVKSIVRLKAKGYRLAVATNPLFPLQAVERRIDWAGLSTDDFELITSFETMHACKPNPLFYHQVLNLLNIEPEEALMVGNDAREDLAAAELGISTYLVTDCLLKDTQQTIVPDHRGTSLDFLHFVEQLPSLL